jgi:hypothetical protein
MRHYNEEFVGFHKYAIGAQIVRHQIELSFGGGVIHTIT